MALLRDDEGRTELPTPQRLGDARSRGQTPISREFTMAGTLLVAVLVLQLAGAQLIAGFEQILRSGMSLQHDDFSTGEPWVVVAHLQDLLLEIAPPFAVLLAAGLGATLLFGYAQIGLRIADKALGFKAERLNPLKNLQRLLNFSAVVRTLLSLGKLCVLSIVPWCVLQANWPTLAAMHEIDDLGTSLGIVADLAFAVFSWVAFAVLLMSVADLAWQRRAHTKSLMMTKQEVDDERKRTEGDPLIKSRMRAARLELMRHRMMEAVPQASVVITNPTHYSIAIKYERGRHAAPEVVAKGADELALKIREIAERHGVPRMEDPPLARALFSAVKVGQEIPERFYRAVAAVLSHVYRMQGQLAK
jgi:flagellar biosynthetic protein FlhB